MMCVHCTIVHMCALFTLYTKPVFNTAQIFQFNFRKSRKKINTMLFSIVTGFGMHAWLCIIHNLSMDAREFRLGKFHILKTLININVVNENMRKLGLHIGLGKGKKIIWKIRIKHAKQIDKMISGQQISNQINEMHCDFRQWYSQNTSVFSD